MWVALAGIALAVYSIYRGNSAEGTPAQRQSQRRYWSTYTWAGIGMAFAAPAAGAAAGSGTSSGAGAAAAGSTPAATGAATTAAAPAATTGTAAVTSELAMTGTQTAAMSMTVSASAVPAVVASTAPQAIAGPAMVGGTYAGVNMVHSEPPQETWWQRMENQGKSGKEKSNVSDWLDNMNTQQGRRQEDEAVAQPPDLDVDYRAISAEQERARREEELMGQQVPIPEGRHGERRWDDWWGA